MQNETANIFIRSDVDLNNDHLYGIGQVAKRFGLTMRAIRFYCELGLIRECQRSGGRYFDVHNVKRLSLVQKAKFLGFPLQRISSLIIDGTAGAHDPVLVITAAEMDKLIGELTTKREQLSHHLNALLTCKRIEISTAA